jgi:hypothetical protein
MTWYTLFRQDTGAYVTHTPRETLTTDSIGVVTRPTEPDEAAEQWNATLRMWEPSPTRTRNTLSRKEFLDQFTSAELGAAMALRRSTDLAIFGAIESFILYVTVSGAIELDSPQVIAGLAFLVTVGVLDAGRPAVIRTPLPA